MKAARPCWRESAERTQSLELAGSPPSTPPASTGTEGGREALQSGKPAGGRRIQLTTSSGTAHTPREVWRSSCTPHGGDAGQDPSQRDIAVQTRKGAARDPKAHFHYLISCFRNTFWKAWNLHIYTHTNLPFEDGIRMGLNDLQVYYGRQENTTGRRWRVTHGREGKSGIDS